MNNAPTAPGPVLELEDICADYGDDGGPTALVDVSFTIGAGELLGLLGPNGCGKSTLFRVVLGLLQPTSGRVHVFGQPPSAAGRRRHQIGYVPQVRRKTDFPITVGQTVMTGRVARIGPLRRPGAADRAAVAEALAAVGLEGSQQRNLADLSGGQRQRVYLARALAQEPELLVLDEPMTGLDIPSQEAIYQILTQRHAAGTTILVATHDLTTVDRFGFDRLLCLNHRVIAIGRPETVLTADVLAATFGESAVAVARVLARAARAEGGQ